MISMATPRYWKMLSGCHRKLGPQTVVVLAHIPFPYEHGLRPTQPGVPGANENFVEGGQTSGGITEVLINQISTESAFLMPSDQEGLAQYAHVRFFNMDAFRSHSSLARWLLTQAGHGVDEN
jgi:hypothetical protein